MSSVLVVDDDPVTRYLLRKILQQCGHTVFEAMNGTTATTLYREHLHDFVLLDILMPDKDGFETLFDLRGINPKAKVIMMTAGGRMTIDLYEQLSRSLRIPHLLTKPFEVDTVLKVVGGILASNPTSGTSPTLEKPQQKQMSL